MTQTDEITKVAGYTSNKYTIYSDDIIITQSNYHLSGNVTEVYTTGWPLDNNPERELANVVGIWYNKSIEYSSRGNSHEPGKDGGQNSENENKSPI